MRGDYMLYVLEYVNEDEYRKLERSLKKYNMLAYKKLIFEYYPAIKNGDFKGKVISKEENITKYELELPTDSMFKKVHGTVTLIYSVDKKDNLVILEKLTPEDILTEGHRTELSTYKGIPISKSHSDKDTFKINLLNMLNKK